MNKEDVKIWYKVLDKDGCACNGGKQDYKKYIKNKKWLPVINEPELCNKGYHITPFWNMWYQDGCRVFIVNPKGIVDIDEAGVVDKFVCKSFRFKDEIKITEKMIDNKDNTEDWNTGYRNTGYWNTGDSNTGYRNTGNRNTGDRNTGYRNTGYRNTGDSNTGNRNTGDWNTGNRNTGDRNTGNWNTGNWNTGDWNTGYFNTNTPKIRMFNKETNIDRESIVFPDFFYFEILENDRDLHKSWKKSFENATKKDIELLLKLPNFDYDIFEEITEITKKMIKNKLQQEVKYATT